MRIVSIEIGRLGVLHDLSFEKLPAGLVVWTGANESGKTTLARLLARALFRLPDRRRRGGDSPAAHDLFATARGLRVVVETAGGERLHLDPQGPPEPGLDHLWGGLDRATAARLLALDLDRLQGLHLLTAEESRSRIAAASAGSEALPGALATLDREIAALLTPGRARRPRIDALTLELDAVDQEIRHLGRATDRYREIADERAQREARLQQLETEIDTVRRERETTPAAGPVPRDERAAVEPPPAAAPAAGRSPLLPRLVALVALLAGLAAALWLASTDAWAEAAAALAAALALGVLGHRLTKRRAVGRSASSPAPKAPTPATAPAPDDGALATLETERAAVWKQLGALEHEAAALAADERLATALTRRESLRTERAEAVHQWAVAALARALLEEARERSERERTPRVLESASRLLRTITGLPSLALELRGERIALAGAPAGLPGDGRRPEAAWSTGLADLAYLAVRLALVRELARGGEPLPMILDDVHLRLDPERRRGLALALVELAREHQVIVFSCQPELAADIAAVQREGAGGGVEVGLFEL